MDCDGLGDRLQALEPAEAASTEMAVGREPSGQLPKAKYSLEESPPPSTRRVGLLTKLKPIQPDCQCGGGAVHQRGGVPEDGRGVIGDGDKGAGHSQSAGPDRYRNGSGRGPHRAPEPPPVYPMRNTSMRPGIARAAYQGHWAEPGCASFVMNGGLQLPGISVCHSDLPS